MRIIVDTHLHFYSCFDLKTALDNLRCNLAKHDKNALCIGILTEASGCNFFNELNENPRKLINSKVVVRSLNNAIYISESAFPDLYLLPGRQIITKENIEILSLLVDVKIKDGLQAQEVVDEIKRQNGIPILSWAPGKWFFERGKVIEKLIRSNKPGSLLIGDTMLRPTIWLKPRLMKKAINRGFTVIGGSDPLPLAGEEKVMGKYATSISCDFDETNPTSSLRQAFLQQNFNPTVVGKRGDIFSTISKILRHTRSKKKT